MEGKNNKITVYPLSKLILELNSEGDIRFLTELLSSFSCEKDKDIEFFLHYNAVKGSELIDYALTIIRSAEAFVGGRYVLIECRNLPELSDLYTGNDFELFDEIPHEDSPMVQMVRTLCDADF